MDNIAMVLKEIGWDWIYLAPGRDQWRACEHGDEPSGSINAGKFFSSCTIGGFSRRAQLHE
jgi:hypothetical protein